MATKYSDQTVEAFSQFSKRADIMKAAGIGRTKYYNLKSDPTFMQQVQERRTETVAAAVRTMESNLIANVNRLQQIIAKPPEKAQIILNALQVYFNTYRAMKKDAEILERVDALEKAIEKR